MPVNMCDMADFIPEMESCWVIIKTGNKLGVHNVVKCLEYRQERDMQKCKKILSEAIDQGNSPMYWKVRQLISQMWQIEFDRH